MKNKPKVLFVAGNWDTDGGRSSKFMEKLINSVTNYVTEFNILSFNGGNYDQLPEIMKLASSVDVVFWFANIPTDLPRVKNIRDINSRVQLISYKRNDSSKYHFSELVSMMLSQKSDLMLETRKNDSGHYEVRSFDALGTVWSDFTTNLSKSVAELFSRVVTIKETTRVSAVRGMGYIPVPKTDYTSSMVQSFRSHAEVVHPLLGTKSTVKRLIGDASFRDEVDAKLVYFCKRHVMRDGMTTSSFVATKIINEELTYFNEEKPSLNAPSYASIYKQFPEVNIIFHTHAYIKDAPFTERSIIDGGLEEFDEITRIAYKNDFSTDFVINQVGHGSIILASGVEYLSSVLDMYESRNVPELINTDFEPVLVDDGVNSYVHTLKGRPIEPEELLEILFEDGSICTHTAKVKAYVRDGIKHHLAYLEVMLKGTLVEMHLPGLKARRI